MKLPLEKKQNTSDFESLIGAIKRAENLPDAKCVNAQDYNPSKHNWDHDSLWFDDWGKWQDYGD